MKIQTLHEIDFTAGQQIDFEASIISITTEGNIQEKKPVKFVVKLEESGDLVNCVSWSSGILNIIKPALNTLDVFLIDGVPRSFNNFNEVRIGQVKNTGKQSNKKIIRTTDFGSMRQELVAIVNQYIHKNNVYHDLINTLVFNNEKFFTWPAATKVHHAYPGGLLKHTLGVVRNVIAYWQSYRESSLDIELLVAGAILHDIGKLTEYNEDGSRTIFGDLLPHPVSGMELVSDYFKSRNINPDADIKILALKHIILSHHNKLEFGAATRPNIPEAYIVALSDDADAKIESINHNIMNIEMGNQTSPLISLDGGKVFKWHN